jgi:peptide/nickel transport system substrate-binding protein
MSSRTRGPLLLAVAFALLASACAGSSSSGDQGDAAKGEITAVFSNIAETPTLDPAVAFSSDGLEFVRNVYEGLLEYKPASVELQPGLAESWQVSPDQKTFTFKLRQGVKFQDGSTLDAAVVKAGLDRIKEVNQGPATLMSGVDSVAAPATDTVVITLKTPDVYFLGTLPKLPIVSQQAVEQHKTAKDPLAADWFTTNAAGTGPYQLESWARNRQINLRRFDGYWRPFPEGSPTKVVLRVDPDVSTALQLLQQGQVDMLGAVGPDESAAAEQLRGVKVVKQPAYEVKTVLLNVTKGPLKDPKVREAIALAFDYKAMLDFFKGYGTTPGGPLPTTLTGIGPAPAPAAQDLDKAKQLLEEAGYGDGKLKLTYLGLKGLSYEEFAGTNLQAQLAKIGVKIEQQLTPWPQMVEIMAKESTSADLSFLNQSVFTNDPTFLLRSAYSSATIASKGGYNWSYYQNPEVDQMLDQVKAVTDAAERERMIGELQQRIVDDHVALYVIQPQLAQPVRAEWDVTYETLDYNYVVRFFYAKKRATQ